MDTILALVLKQEQQLLQPETHRSVQMLDALLDDSFIEIGASGRIYSKEDVLKTLPFETNTIIEVRDFRARILTNDIVLITYCASNWKNNKFSLRSSLWKYKDERWKMIFHQGTPADRSFYS